MRRYAALLAAVACSAPISIAVQPATSHADTNPPAWLTAVNDYRAQAGLPPVTEDPNLSAADLVHAKYMAATHTVTHAEAQGSPYYSDEGNNAGLHSNVASGPFSTSADAIDEWMRLPFHAMGILRPTLTHMGYGQVVDAAHNVVYAALNVSTATDGSPSLTWPMVWPSSNGHVHLLSYNGPESPDPLTSCSGYETSTNQTAGLPLIVRLGPDATAPSNVTATLTSASTTLPTCVITESTYTNPDAATQAGARQGLAEDHTIVVIPQHSLSPLTSYSLHVDADGKAIDDTFTTDKGQSVVRVVQQSSPAYDGEPTYIGAYIQWDGGLLAGRTVQVYAGADGAQSLVATTTSRSDGTWSAAVRPSGSVRYVAKFAGDSSYLPSESLPIVVRTAPRPTVLLRATNATGVPRGRAVLVDGLLISEADGKRMPGFYIALWAKPYGSTWRLVGTKKTDSHGEAPFLYTVRSTTTFEFKYAGRLSSYPRYRSSVSKTITVRAL